MEIVRQNYEQLNGTGTWPSTRSTRRLSSISRGWREPALHAWVRAIAEWKDTFDAWEIEPRERSKRAHEEVDAIELTGSGEGFAGEHGQRARASWTLLDGRVVRLQAYPDEGRRPRSRRAAAEAMPQENVELVRRLFTSGTGLPGSVKRQRISRASSSIKMSRGTISASFPVRRIITGSRRSGDISPPPRRLSTTSARTCLSCSTPTRGYSLHTAFTPVAERAAPRSSAMPSTSTASATRESRA